MIRLFWSLLLGGTVFCKCQRCSPLPRSRSDFLFHCTTRTGRQGDFSSIHLQLSTSQRKLIQSFNFPCHDLGRSRSVRVDAIYPLVFEESEPIEGVWIGNSQFLANSDCETYGLRVKLIFDGDREDPIPFKINSVSLDIESATVPVSKEMLGVHSDFFTTLFYGDFTEKKSGSFCVKEVDQNDFVWLIDSLMERKWNVTSVDQALAALDLADRFCMPYVHKHILPYLKATELEPNAETRVAALKRYIDLAVRCNDNGDFVCWIFEKCQKTSELIAVGQSCGQTLTPHLAVYFRFLSEMHSEEERMASQKLSEVESKASENERKAKEEYALLKKDRDEYYKYWQNH